MQTDILIIGAGLGGFACFKKLQKKLKKHKITLVDQNNFLTFAPMLHEVATGSIQPNHCTAPIREHLKGDNTQFLKTKITKIDLKNKTAHSTNYGKINYQYCVIATGSQINFFNVPGTDKFAYHVRTLKDAKKLHSKLVNLLEDPSKETIHINVVGGGATGVELAGQFADLSRKEITKLYPHKNLKISLIQSADSIINYTHPHTQKKAEQQLRKLGVEIHYNTRVNKVSKNSLTTNKEKSSPSDITAWTAGFRCTSHELIQEDLCQNGRIKINKFLQIPTAPYHFAIGDTSLNQQNPHPQTGEIADRQGKHTAQNIIRSIKEKPIKAFTYRSKGTLIPIGEWFALAELGKLRFSGRFAWWLRRTVYLMSMPGFIRKMKIVTDWTLNCFTSRNLNESE